MDPLKKVTDDLSLLGGELSIDQFLEVRNSAKIAAAPAPPPKAARTAPPAQKTAKPIAATTRKESRGQEDSSEDSDTGKLRLEVEAFMNRDSAEDTDDLEVREFLKDRAGFDPSDLG